jgi:plastocyanin
LIKKLSVLFVLFFGTGFLTSLAVAGELAGRAGEGYVAVWLEGSLPKDVPAPITIAQRGVKFTPDFVVVVAGQRVEFPNEDNVAHNVYSASDAKQLNLGVYEKGESRSVVFEQPGLVQLHCWLHKRMNADIIVVPNRFHADARSGTFRITGVPAGTYRLVAMLRDGTRRTKNVTVAATGVLAVDF